MIIFGRNSFVLGLTGIQSNYFIAAHSVLCFEFLFKTHQWFFTIIEQYLHSVKFFSLPSFIFISKLPNTPVSRLKVVRRLGAPQPGQQFQTDQWELPQHVMLCLGIKAHEMTEERDMLLIMAFVFPNSCNMWLCFPGCRWTSAYWWDAVNEFLFWSNSIFFSLLAFTCSLCFFSIKLSLCWSIILLTFFLFSLCSVEKGVRKRLDECCLRSSHYKFEK